MALTLRPTGLSPAYKDDLDFVIYDDGEAVGRLYEIGGIGTPPDVRWFWSMTVYVDARSGIVTSGKVPTLDEAKERFRASWEKVARSKADD